MNNKLMKLTAIITLCLLILTSCNKTNVAVSPEQNPQVQTVSVIVYGLGGEVTFSFETEWHDGITAFDILLECAKEKNIPVAYSGSKSSAYITSIGGLAEKQHGGMSGWIYTLNGESIMTPCGKCVLSPGDSVEFKYITEF